MSGKLIPVAKVKGAKSTKVLNPKGKKVAVTKPFKRGAKNANAQNKPNRKKVWV